MKAVEVVTKLIEIWTKSSILTAGRKTNTGNVTNISLEVLEFSQVTPKNI